MTRAELFFSKLFGLGLLILLSFMAGFQLSYTSTNFRHSVSNFIFLIEVQIQNIAALPFAKIEAEYFKVESIICLSIALFLSTLGLHLLIKTISLSLLNSLGRGIDSDLDQ